MESSQTVPVFSSDPKSKPKLGAHVKSHKAGHICTVTNITVLEASSGAKQLPVLRLTIVAQVHHLDLQIALDPKHAHITRPPEGSHQGDKRQSTETLTSAFPLVKRQKVMEHIQIFPDWSLL